MAKIMEITISTTAEIKVETSGFMGGECKEATRKIEAALGVTTKDTQKPEMFEQAKKVDNYASY